MESFKGQLDFGGGWLMTGGGLYDYDMFLTKLDAAGNHIFSKRFGGDGPWDYGEGVAVDGAGDIAFTGYGGVADFGGGVLTSAGDDDVFVAKFNAAGDHLWSKRFGDVPGFSWDVFVAKYDDAGAYIWAKRFGTQWSENGTAVASDAQGNVLLTGSYNDSINLGGQTFTSDDGVFIAKFAP